MNSTEQDLKDRKGQAWKALNGMTRIWSSDLLRGEKLSLFFATAASVLLYSSECWVLIPKLKKALDSCYMRMLRAALNISWQDHTNKVLYGEAPRVNDKLQVEGWG